MKAYKFPWYDSVWLSRYVNARDFIACHYPEKLEGFLSDMEILRTRPDFTVQHLPSVFSGETLSRIRSTIALLRPDELELHEIKTFGRWIVHNHQIFTELQAATTDMVSQLVGEAVEPCYNFLSMYTRLGHCPLHMDAPQAKWTLDVCINQSEPWNIHFSQIVPWPEAGVQAKEWQKSILADSRYRFSTYALLPGEAVLFSGSSQWHYRKPLPNASGGAFCDLLFFHYIPKGTSAIANEENWPAHFGIPELAEIVGDGLVPSRWHFAGPETRGMASG